MNPTGFIFDLDGVLTDTAEYHYLAWKRLAKDEGIPFTREKNEALRGVSRRESLLILLNGKKCAEDNLHELMERKNGYYLDYVRGLTSKNLLPGSLDLLIEIQQTGNKSALASASKNARLVIDLLGIGPLFDAISDGQSVNRQKPAPDLFFHAANQIAVNPPCCVVFEDAEAGIDAAIAGNFRSVGLGPKARVGKADLIFPSLENIHLPDILKLLGEKSE